MAATETSARANAALDDLYRRHVGDVYRYTYAVLGNHADAEDVTQTTFVNALRAMERGDEPDEPSRWLLVIAHNLVRQRWRQAASRPALVELETDVPDAETDDDGVQLEELVRALQRIPPTQREALVMRELEGRSYGEIADVLGLTTSALETLLFRARRSLAEEIENVVTCQNAELAISKRLDGRLSRKDRKRLEEHLAECDQCARLATTQARQRKAFKGLALLPLPVGLALFKGAPSAAAATSLPTIGLGAAGTSTAGTGTGVAGAASGGAAAAGGSLAGGIAIKVAAVAVVASVATGVGYKGVQAVRDTPSKPAPAHVQAPVRDAVPKTPTRPAGSSHARATSSGKALGHAKRNGHARGTSAAAAKRENGRSPASPPGLARKSAVGERRNAPDATARTTHPPKPAAGRPTSKPTKPPKKTTSPTKPKPEVTAPRGADSPKAPAAPKNGGPSTSPVAPVAPTAPTVEDDAGGSDDGTIPVTAEPTTGDDSGEPTATPPSTTPTTTTPTGTTPTADPAPVDTGPGGSEPTSTPSDGSEGGSPSPGAEGADSGRKLGHKKGNHDGKHPEDS